MGERAADAAWTQVPTLTGRHVSLVPLAPAHADALAIVTRDSGLHTAWYTNVSAPDDVPRYIDRALDSQAAGEALAFAVLDADGIVVGSTRFYDLDAAVPNLKIGYTWYAPRVQRTGLNTEAKLLLCTRAFDVMGCASVAFETSWFNHASRAAIARLGNGAGLYAPDRSRSARMRSAQGRARKRTSVRARVMTQCWAHADAVLRVGAVGLSADAARLNLTGGQARRLATPADSPTVPTRPIRGVETRPADGVLRHHKRHADGSLRDTVVFSVIDAEWPAVRRHLRHKLDSHP